jgi:hypothetical protein
VHEAHIGTTRGPHIADGREPGEQRLAGVHDTAKRGIRRSLGDVDGPIALEITGEVNVDVGEPGRVTSPSSITLASAGGSADGLDVISR